MYVCMYVCMYRVQHRVHKVTTLTVTYVENCAYLLLVSKAICVNVQNLSCTQIMSLQAKLNGCDNSVVKSVAAWLAWRVTDEHIEFKGVGRRERTWDKRGGHARNLEDSHHVCMYTCVHIYIYIYIYMHTPIYIYVYIYTHTHIYTYIYAYIYTHTHTYIYIYMYICINLVGWVLWHNNLVGYLISNPLYTYV